MAPRASWMRSDQVGLLLGRSYLQAATMVTAIIGFRKCGIWPVDRNVFTDADFLAAETTNTENIVTDDSSLVDRSSGSKPGFATRRIDTGHSTTSSTISW
ncbi:hypothetical protein O0L34_g16909 [Tuta absoluta]|nr:hypothetical protein O0L34_g16909 [Tuta absoluta]